MKPDFSWTQWTSEQMRAAAEAALAHKKEAYAHIKTIPADQRTFANTIGALERADDALADVTQIAELMVSVHPDVAMRDAAQAVSEHIDRENIKLEYDRDLWRAVNEWHAESEQLSDPDKKLYEDTMRDMRRRGFALPNDAFTRLKQLIAKLKKTEQEFERAINDYQDHIEITREQLAGLPDRYIDGLKRTDEGTYIVSL